ncbi:hypothetical protein [Zavarzinella formosa]|uniref:hypothetical protein n=1 Tax=Zavarzinella formosa TaxID=360055 RepID=UPI0002FA2CEF|nr:hypothetical protein [Zavarzinella formosa]
MTTEKIEDRRRDKADMSRAEIDSIRVVHDVMVEPMEGAEEYLRAKAAKSPLQSHNKSFDCPRGDD